MNKNKILSGGGKNLIGGGKWERRGREVGEKGEGSGGKGGGNWEWGTPCPPPQNNAFGIMNFYIYNQELIQLNKNIVLFIGLSLMASSNNYPGLKKYR